MEDRNLIQNSPQGSSPCGASHSQNARPESDELVNLRQENAELREQLSAIEISRSWRITKPLRHGFFLARHARWHTFAGLRLSVNHARVNVRHGYCRARSSARMLPAPVKSLLRPLIGIVRNFEARFIEPHNMRFLNKLVDKRQKDEPLLIQYGGLVNASMTTTLDNTSLPLITISLVTYNSSKWLDSLFSSIESQSYPLNRIEISIVDNGSKDDTLSKLAAIKNKIGGEFANFQLHQRPNLGFGAAHNWAIQHSTGAFTLITNPDLEFDSESILRVVTLAVRDHEDVACWELRQRPFEHPKHYDPVTWETHWSSHACILIRRTSFNYINGYDERIFLYGEDVEFSFRIREAGFRLRYCPNATVAHYTYEEAHQVKPAQYLGSTRSNLYLRLRYGTLPARLATIGLAFASIARPQPFKGARKKLLKEYVALIRQVPTLKRERTKAGNHNVGVFRGLDYEMTREGAFVSSDTAIESLTEMPLVSIITRTYKGRDWLLNQAGISVLNQTYRNIEWIVVEDGGEHCSRTVAQLAKNSDLSVYFYSQEKLGRSSAGNLGLLKARGEWCLFLDDDDLIYADHIELLIRTAIESQEPLAGVYSLAWDVMCDIDKEKHHINEQLYQLHGHHRLPFSHERLSKENFISIQAIMFRHSLYRDLGGFNTEFDQLEDWNLWRRYSHRGSFKLVEKTTSLYRTPSDPAIRQQRQIALDYAYQNVKNFTDKELSSHHQSSEKV